jgi:hypothetical protein
MRQDGTLIGHAITELQAIRRTSHTRLPATTSTSL